MTKKKREKQKIRVFTAFSGYDSQMMAMKRLERDYPDLIECELVGWSEIDGPAIKSHNAVFPEAADLNLGDISKINWEEVPDFDLFTYSSPCFVAGTKVRTKSGYKNIEDIQIGDEVVSHTGNYRKVTDVMSHEYTGMFLIEVSGSVRNAAGYQRGRLEFINIRYMGNGVNEDDFSFTAEDSYDEVKVFIWKKYNLSPITHFTLKKKEV